MKLIFTLSLTFLCFTIRGQCSLDTKTSSDTSYCFSEGNVNLSNRLILSNNNMQLSSIKSGLITKLNGVWSLNTKVFKGTTLDSVKVKVYKEDTDTVNNCYELDSIYIVIHFNDMSIYPLSPVCYNEGAVNLSSDVVKSPNTTFFCDSPSVVKKVGNIWWFYPNKLSPPGNSSKNIKVYYFVTNTHSGCMDKDSFLVTINPAPTVILNNRIYCQDIKEVDLNDPNNRIIQFPQNLGGGIQTWIEIGTSGYLEERNPSSYLDKDYWLTTQFPDKTKVGKVTMKFKFTDVVTGCEDCDTAVFEIKEVPTVSFDFLPGQCTNSDILNLDDYVNLSFGKWTVKKENNLTEAQSSKSYASYIIDNHLFDPSIADANFGPTKYDVNFYHDLSGCPTKDSTSFWVYKLPKLDPVVIPPLCNTDDAYDLQVRVDNSFRPGVVWSGTHVNGSQFIPSMVGSDTAQDISGPYTITYSYTNPTTTCSNSDSTTVIVQAQPTVNILNPFNRSSHIHSNEVLVNAESTHDNGILWESLGDGNFGDPSYLNTRYHFGTNDKAKLNTTLLLRTLPYGICPSDTQYLELNIYPLSTKDINKSGVSVFPTIFNHTLNISSTGKPVTKIEFYNELGQRALIKHTAGDTDIKINKSGLPTGKYLIKVYTENEIYQTYIIRK